ncbi:MAG: ATP-grasp domain-containing protein [Acidimicrobiia bacterium]|nr:ATP-grasp domain-containing protein [Acidimicrobiia bacterium]
MSISISIELVAALAGVVLLLTAAVWAARLRRDAVRQLRLAILDPDPSTRKAAVLVAAERGLAPFADVLVERVRDERSPQVRRALAEAVARSQWEPADSSALVELRVWAQEELSSSTASAPSPPARPRTEPQPQNLSDLENGPEKQAQTAPAPNIGEVSAVSGVPPVAVLEKETASSPEPVIIERPVRTVVRRPARLTVVVTGAGGPAGIAAVRALAGAGHRVVAADADPLAAGIRLAQRSGVLPRVDDPSYVERLCDLAFDNGARAVVPTLAEELVVLARHRRDLEDVGVESWVPDPDAVERCCDKWRFAAALKEVGLSGPATGLGSADGVPGPWIVKPRFGRGSRDVYSVDDAEELKWALGRVPEPIVQTRLEGREFTVDALVDRDGELAGAVPRWRLETKAGISTKGRTFSHPELAGAVGALLRALGMTGPANVQGFVADGRARFIEVNPRFSGGLPLSLAAGADLVGEYLRGIFGEPLRRERLEYRPGVTMTRHFEEHFE